MALTKDAIISRVYEEAELGKNQSRRVVERLFRIMKQAIEKEDELLVSGFGKFVVKKKNSRRGRNPQTNEDLQLRARKVVVFKTSGVLRSKLNHG